jgi:putative lipoprotein (rSAM/lipoprotein system)
MNKKIKLSFLRSASKLILIILGLTGFAVSCKHEDEYGTPMADFILQGTVKSKTDFSLLPDIKVTLNYNTGMTDAQGYYNVTVQDFPDAHTYDLRFHDTDSTQNGNFKDKDTTISFAGNNLQGGDGKWYEGTEIKIADILLEPKP